MGERGMSKNGKQGVVFNVGVWRHYNGMKKDAARQAFKIIE
jgi:hypothetical protein